jgi:hypothetical protein
MRPSSYRIPNGCWNCKYLYRQLHYDEIELYCLNGGTGKPLKYSGQIQSNEQLIEQIAIMDKFDQDNGVEFGGICDEWKKRAL